MWYLYLMIGVAALTLAVPLLLIYWTDKRKLRAFDKRNKSAFDKRNKKSDDMADLDHY